jgi:hypothetical protein
MKVIAVEQINKKKHLQAASLPLIMLSKMTPEDHYKLSHIYAELCCCCCQIDLFLVQIYEIFCMSFI